MRSLPRPLSEFSSSAIWIDNSRVGARISACGLSSPGSLHWMIGMPNAAVLPVPVCACPIRSFSPDRSFGMVRAWIGEGVSNPLARNASRISSDTPRLRNCSRSLINAFRAVCCCVKQPLCIRRETPCGVRNQADQLSSGSARDRQQSCSAERSITPELPAEAINIHPLRPDCKGGFRI